MKATEFCYWLQGMFELNAPESLTAEQTELIKRHLDMVFYHEIDQSYSNSKELSKIHSGTPSKRPPRPGDTTIRC